MGKKFKALTGNGGEGGGRGDGVGHRDKHIALEGRERLATEADLRVT